MAPAACTLHACAPRRPAIILMSGDNRTAAQDRARLYLSYAGLGVTFRRSIYCNCKK